MADSKRDLVRECIKRRALDAIKIKSAEMLNREQGEIIRANAEYLACGIAWHLCAEYEFLELSDLFEWRRERVRR
jgi:hypothetical protein